MLFFRSLFFHFLSFRRFHLVHIFHDFSSFKSLPLFPLVFFASSLHFIYVPEFFFSYLSPSKHFLHLVRSFLSYSCLLFPSESACSYLTFSYLLSFKQFTHTALIFSTFILALKCSELTHYILYPRSSSSKRLLLNMEVSFYIFLLFISLRSGG